MTKHHHKGSEPYFKQLPETLAKWDHFIVLYEAEDLTENYPFFSPPLGR